MSERKTAIKLINKYADSYNILQEENKTLKLEINDLKSTLEINKEILNHCLSQKNIQDKDLSLIHFFKKEINAISQQNNTLLQRIHKLEDEKSIKENHLNIIQIEYDALKMKVFLLEQDIISKDNEITKLKKKNDKSSKTSRDFIRREKSLDIISPTKPYVKLNDELILYKTLYTQLTDCLKKKTESMMEYKEMLNDLEQQNGNLRTENKLQELSAYRDKITLVNKFQLEIKQIEDKTKRTSTSENIRMNERVNDYLPYHREKKKIQTQKELFPNIRMDKIDFNDELQDILKEVGLTKAQFIEMSMNPFYASLTDAIELMFNLIYDKNIALTLLEDDNEILRKQNETLNTENMNLLKEQKKEHKDSINTNTTTLDNINLYSIEYYKTKTLVKLINDDEPAENNCKEVHNDKDPLAQTMKSIASFQIKDECPYIQSFVSNGDYII